MESHVRGHEISGPRLLESQALPSHSRKQAVEALPWPASARPLSDIREITEPSLIDGVSKRCSSARLRLTRSASRTSLTRCQRPEQRNESVRARPTAAKATNATPLTRDYGSSSSYTPSPDHSSFYAIPQSSVPRRSSSQGHARKPSNGHARKPSIRTALQAHISVHQGQTVPNRGQSDSPVKEAGLRLDPITADAARRVPSQTHIRTPHPSDILEFPSYKHPRVRLELQVLAPLFVGGGTVEGFIKLSVDDNERLKHRRSLGIGAMSVDLLGFEEVSGNRKAIFLALGTDLIDQRHTPPSNMIEPVNPLATGDKFWTLKPSTSALPFMVSLPLDTGPPPFHSKQANIRYLLGVTVLISDVNKHYRVRTCQDICVLPTYDPEKALASLPSPLTAVDELPMPRAGGYESLKVTAGLHRQVWVSGCSIFVDVHIANKSRKTVKRLDLSLERDILCYKHAAAGTREKSAGQARIFENNHRSMLIVSTMRLGTNGWNGVEPRTSETRTYELELPRGHATVKCGKYFEVRYFLNITVSSSNTKLVSVQLPIILIHVNSLDAVPNSVAQVAAAIEEKRAIHHRRRSSEERQHRRVPSRRRSMSSPAREKDLRRQPSYNQGRAFAAPRQQSLDRRRAEKADLDDIGRTIDSSPRKHQPYFQAVALKKVGSNISFGNVSLGGNSVQEESPFHVMAYENPTPQRSQWFSKSRAEKASAGVRDQMSRMKSFDSFYSRQSETAPAKPNVRIENTRPLIKHIPSNQSLAPHTLGLSTTVAQSDGMYSRPKTPSEVRDRLDRSRFEFKAVRRKASGSIRERGMNWWEHLKHREEGREGWI